MGDEGLLHRQGEFELSLKEFTKSLANLLCFLPGTYEAEKKVIGVPNVAQPSVVRVARGPCNQLAAFAFQAFDLVEVFPPSVSVSGKSRANSSRRATEGSSDLNSNFSSSFFLSLVIST